MRLAFIGPANSLHFHRRTNWFARRGHQVLVLAHRWPVIPEYSPNVRLALCNFEDGRTNPLETLRWMRRELEDFEPDVVHAHKLDYPGLFALFLGFSPLAVTLWDGIQVRDPHIRPAQRELIPLAGKRADLFTTNSPGLLAESLTRGVPEDRTLLTSWGVDSEIFFLTGQDSHQHDPDLRARYGLDSEAVVIFSPRVLTAFSNLDTLVRSLEAVLRSEPRAHLLMASYASTDDGIASFSKLLADSPARERVTFCGWIRSQAELAAHYRLADAVVSLYSGYLESSPASIIEAMLCGAVPVVADHPVIDFWIHDGAEGVLVDHRDPESVARGILRALAMGRDDPDLLLRNRAKVLEQADYHATMPLVEKEYARLAKAFPPRFHAAPALDGPCSDRGLLLEALARDREALLTYDEAGDRKRAGLLREWLAKDGLHLDPAAVEVFSSGGKGLDRLPPPPSGNMREYVWAAPMRRASDAEVALDWIHGLARTFGYDTDYLTALAALRPDASSEAVRSLLVRAQPVNLLLVPVYTRLARENMLQDEDNGQERWQRLAQACWQGQDERFIPELKSILLYKPKFQPKKSRIIPSY